MKLRVGHKDLRIRLGIAGQVGEKYFKKYEDFA